MDLAEIIHSLRVELQKVNEAIAVLEEALRTQGARPPPQRRGRKSMGPEERREVSERMKAYWAKRKQGNKTREK